jgi:predicted nucleic acid-binding protein
MQLVIDTSAIIAVIANEAEKPALLAATTGAELIAPASLHWEIGNAFSAMLKRKRIGLEQAVSALTIYHQIPLRLVEVPLSEALAISDQCGIYAYDAYFLAAAQSLRCELLTLDRGLIRAAAQVGIPVREVKP